MEIENSYAEAAAAIVSDEVANPILERFYGSVESLNAAIVELESAGIKWDLDIVDHKEPIAVQTARARSFAEDGINLLVEIRELCGVPGFQMAFSEYVGRGDAA